MANKILLVKTSSLGDVIHALPAISDVKTAMGDAQVDWVVEDPLIAVPRLHSGVARVIPVSLRRWRRALWRADVRREISAFLAEIRRQEYDAVIDAQGLFKSALIALAARGRRYGLDFHSSREPLALFYHHSYRISWQLHAVERTRLLLARSLGYEVPAHCSYGISAAPRRFDWLAAGPYAVLLHATSGDYKLWPERNWSALGNALNASGVSCVLPWGDAHERARSERIAVGLRSAVVPPILNLDRAGRIVCRREGGCRRRYRTDTPCRGAWRADDRHLLRHRSGGDRPLRRRARSQCRRHRRRTRRGTGDCRSREARMIKSRFGYTLLLCALLPQALLHLLWRARRQPAYLKHVAERFGRFAVTVEQPLIWVHAVSVGETRAAEPLIGALQSKYPQHRILLTHMTPTGRETGEALFGGRVQRCYLPYDFPFAVARFLDHFKPVCGILLETEIWPNLIHACRVRNIPLYLVNARLSEKSFRRYRRFAALAAASLRELSGIAAQSQRDAEHLQALGATAVQTTGNLKFDIAPDPELVARGGAWREAYGKTRPVLLAASTREGEEALLLQALREIDIPQLLVVIVPRHPQRFDEVETLLGRVRIPYQRRSAGQPIAAATRIVLGDSMGEMLAYYAACDVAIIGGSLLPFGAQNLIEACAVGRPVIIGPHTYNFAEATRGCGFGRRGIAGGGCARRGGSSKGVAARPRAHAAHGAGRPRFHAAVIKARPRAR